MKQTDDDMIADIRKRLDEGTEQLDPAITGRLRAARRTALEAGSRPRLSYRPVLAGGVALATVLFVIVYVGRGPITSEQNGTELARLAGDMEIITEADNLELFDDLEFYQWLAESESHAG
jgi:hypothetical protein